MIVDQLEQAADEAPGDEAAGKRTYPSLLDWVMEHRYIQNRQTRIYDRFRLDDYPWMVQMYEEIGGEILNVIQKQRPPGLRILLRKAAQVSATELAVNVTLYCLVALGLSVFYAVPPGANLVGDFAHTRLDTAISQSPDIADAAGDIDNVGLKTFRKANLYVRGTHIPQGRPDRAAQLAQVPADVAVIDEWDRIPPAAIPLIRDRLGDSSVQIEFGLSTPTYPGVGIDAAYQESDRREPMIQCQDPDCGEWSSLDWSLVDDRDGQIALWCPHCGNALDRDSAWDQKRIRFEAQNAEATVIGYWIPKLLSPRVRLEDLWERSQHKQPAEVQAFWNNDLGVGYEPEGARLSLELIRAAMGDHTLDDTPTSTWSAMGVDVGLALHVWIMEPMEDGQQRTVFVGEVLEWQELDRLLARYGVGCCVVDDAPELVADVAFARRHRGRVFLATYMDDMPGAEWTAFDLKKQKVRVDRTAGLDRAHGNIEGQIDVLPADLEYVPDVVDQLRVNLKAKAVKPDGTVYYHFPQTGRPDHYDHAKTYAEAAMERLRRLRPPAARGNEGEAIPASGSRRYRGRM
jgi:hypothetical protein